jgi:hypothetical protein
LIPGRYNAYEGRAFQYAFLIYQLGIAPSIYRTKSYVKSTVSTNVTPPELITMFQAFHITALMSTALQIGLFKQLKGSSFFDRIDAFFSLFNEF